MITPIEYSESVTERLPSSIHQPDDDGRFLSKEVYDRILRSVLGFTRGGGDIRIIVSSHWEGGLRWARNRATLASNRRTISVQVGRSITGGGNGSAETNQVDDVSLEATVRAAERSVLFVGGARTITGLHDPMPTLPVPTVAIWSDATYHATDAVRGEIGRVLSVEAEDKGMLSAGYLEMRAGQIATLSRTGVGDEYAHFDRYTNSQCSMTVRDPKGVASGWAGLSGYDWAMIDGKALATRALERSIASMNPVTIEPGRYDVVLEPQAVYQFIRHLNDALTRVDNELGYGPFSLGYDAAIRLGRSRLGLQVVDKRITLRHDPTDPMLGVLPVMYKSPTLDPVTSEVWIDQGVLTKLSYNRDYALESLNENMGAYNRPSFRMDGGTTTIEEMIATTKRGIHVTRFSNVRMIDKRAILLTGFTRDGLWLIENGKISKSVKNFRFTESPLFVLNQLEALGPSVPVFTDDRDYPWPAIVPPLKAHDFSFTALVDAI